MVHKSLAWESLGFPGVSPCLPPLPFPPHVNALGGYPKGNGLAGDGGWGEDCRTVELQGILEVMADTVSVHPIPLPLPCLCSKPDFQLSVSAVLSRRAFSSHQCAFT